MPGEYMTIDDAAKFLNMSYTEISKSLWKVFSISLEHDEVKLFHRYYHRSAPSTFLFAILPLTT